MDLRSRNKVDPSFNMSSMTDLVFLLLIFFIILSTMVSPYALPVDLPNSSNKSSDKQTVSLRIDADNNYSVGTRIINPVNLEYELQQALSVQTEKSLVLHVDKAVPTGQTVEVLDIAKRNRWKIVLATKPK
ncbi:MAG: biopolymer transporter ExbD [Bacteroidetes bacterium]|jgi:biopolymer transport protein ExbD|nr:biopolymer transporter ExbD [Bacteroidota bacterium]MDA0972596.1 biopolymer transporter ExbD [Bacteroidota bacterium]